MKLTGIIPAIVTPMHADESVNTAELRTQVDRQIAAGASAIFCLGTNGEFYALSLDEKTEIIRVVVEQTAGRLPVLAGTGCITTADTIRLTHLAKEAGVQAVSVITPYFADLNQNGVYAHYTALADRCDIPILLYNIPARTGVNIDSATLARLCGHERIIGIKDSSGNFDNTLRYIEETPEDFTVLVGNDSLILSTLLAGGQGAISGIANLFPERMADIYSKFLAGDIAGAARVQKSVRVIRDAMKLGNPNSVVKRAANLLGYPVGPARAPFDVKDPASIDKIEKALEFYR